MCAIRGIESAGVVMSDARAFSRRSKSVPAVLALCVVLTSTLPVWLCVALVVDVVRALFTRKPFMAMRIGLFGWVYACAETWGIAVLALQAVRYARDPQGLIDSAYRTQAAWTSVLYRALVRLFNLHFVVDGDASCVPGPVVVLVRHASIIDTLVPSVFLTARHGLKLRFVLKRELLVDPCLDIAGLRLPNHFVSRSGADGERERAAIEALARGMTSSEGALIYPEGTRMTPVRKLKALERLGAHQDLYARAAALLHVMPPRTGGTLALLHGAPTADVVIVAHRGLEGFAYVSDLWRGDVVGKLVHVHVTRVPRAEIPASDDACTLWLYDVWAQMDAWIDDVTRGLPRPSQQLRQ